MGISTLDLRSLLLLPFTYLHYLYFCLVFRFFFGLKFTTKK
jgi:hypothetical protein